MPGQKPVAAIPQSIEDLRQFVWPAEWASSIGTEQTVKHILAGLAQRHIGIRLPSERREIRWECLAIPLTLLEFKAAPRGSQESTKKQVDRGQSLRGGNSV